MSLIADISNFAQLIMNFFYNLIFAKSLTFPACGLTVSFSDNSAIGEGAFSTVYKAAKVCDSENLFALKKVSVQSKEIDDLVRKEIDAFRRFNHPNILKLIDFAEQSESGTRIVYMLLPFMRKGSLRDSLNKVLLGDRPKPKLIMVFSQFLAICEALNALHTFNPPYIHLDIKPENILIDDDNTPILADFGSVRIAIVEIKSRIEALNVSEEAAQYCTASYRPPELYDPQKDTTLDTRTDVWSMGCLLFAWWFGYSPFECEFHGCTVKVVETNLLRVLSNMPRCNKPSPSDTIVMDTVEWILNKDMGKRPFTSEIISRISEIIQKLESNDDGFVRAV